MKAFLCEFLISCLLAAPGARSVDELAYGNMLYAYFQADHEQALVDIMVAEQRGQLGTDPQRFALAKGSLAFAEGLYRMSDSAFAGIDPGSLSEIDRMRLAFHRARFHYRNADWDAMSGALDSIRLDPTWFGREVHHPEVQFMRAEAALAAGNLATAERALTPLPDTEDYLGYGLFNLAVAQRAAADQDGARATLARLAELPLASDAGRDLVARARLGLAMTAYERAATPRTAANDDPGAQPLDAHSVLDRLPASSRYREQALALYGNLAMQRGDYRLAARIWLTLQQGEAWHAGRAPAGLGLPLALEGLGQPDAALDGYRRAAVTFETRLAALDRLAGDTREPAWAGRLLRASLPAQGRTDATDRAVDANPTRDADELPDIAEVFGTGAWSDWLADEEVSRLLREWQTLDRMRQWLDGLPARLEALDQVKAERARRSTAARAALAEQDLLERRDALAADVDRLERRVGELGDQDRGTDAPLIAALADAGETKALARIDRLAADLATAPATSERAALEGRLDRLRGVVLWTVAEARSARVRALVNELDATRAVLDEMNARIARIERAEAELNAGAVADFTAVGNRAATLNALVATGLATRETALADTFRAAVEREVTRTADYLLQAQVAIARTSDQLAAAAGPAEPGS